MTKNYQKLTDKELDNVSGGWILFAAKLGWRVLSRMRKVVQETSTEAKAGQKVNPLTVLWRLTKPGWIH